RGAQESLHRSHSIRGVHRPDHTRAEQGGRLHPPQAARADAHTQDQVHLRAAAPPPSATHLSTETDAMYQTALCQDLLARCYDSGIVPPDVPLDIDQDLLESSVIDSMGLVTLQCLVEEAYGVYIPEAVFVAELRSLRRIASHIDATVRTAGRAEDLAA